MYVEQILYKTCYNTLEMVFNDFNSYPEFREGLFTLIRDIIKHCTQGLFALDASRFDNMIKSINFAVKHTKPEICDLGLEALGNLTNLVVGADASTRNLFFQKYLVLILDETLHVMTEQTYISGFHEQAMILNMLF
jgi:exportin-1